MRDWLEKGTPLSFWLPAFFFPQGFMTATMQTYARSTKTPIDTLAFRTNVLPLTLDDIKEKPEIGVNIHGMFMQGAKWDYNKKCVEDSDPKVAIIQFPVIWVEPIEDKDYNLDKKYQCPLYKTSVRAGELSTTGHSTNFVLFIDLPSEQGGDYWVRRGTALLCMTDE
jgi:dynein heavy chain